MLKKLGSLVTVVCVLCAVGGCDPLTVHKVTSTIFDGVPSLPPAQEYCQDFEQKKAVEAKLPQQTEKKADTASYHPPYKAKQCNRCHDKTKDSGLIKPKNEICFVCHPKIVSNSFAHGPAAVGSCLECHDPHSSPNPSLLKNERAKVCVACHKETRLAEAMHDKVTASGLFCMDCHNPHAGSARYFLR
jgi:predicted CXXCH cytochrome family protein